MFVRPAVFRGQKSNVGHYSIYTQIVQPNLFILTMIIGTIDFYHLIPLSLILTLSEGHKVSEKQNLLTSFSSHFSSEQDDN